MIKLTTKAITSGGYEYDVVLRKGAMGWVLSVEGTSGSWYMESIDHLANVPEDHVPPRLAIDWGQGWYWENPQPIILEARNAIYREGKL